MPEEVPGRAVCSPCLSFSLRKPDAPPPRLRDRGPRRFRLPDGTFTPDIPPSSAFAVVSCVLDEHGCIGVRRPNTQHKYYIVHTSPPHCPHVDSTSQSPKIQGKVKAGSRRLNIGVGDEAMAVVMRWCMAAYSQLVGHLTQCQPMSPSGIPTVDSTLS